MFNSTVYVRIYINKMTVKHIESGAEITEQALEPFTTNRLLVGSFQPAEILLRKLIKKVAYKNIFSISPVALIHPTIMIEGGLSEIEDRALRELGASVGSRNVHIWVGHELTDNEVIHRIKTT